MGEPTIVSSVIRTKPLVAVPVRAVGIVAIVGHTRRADSDYLGEPLSLAGLGTITLDYEDGISDDTITRSSGSWIEDGAAVGGKIQVENSASNNDGVYTITVVTDLIITIGTSDLTVDEASTTIAIAVYDLTVAITPDIPKEFSNLSDIQSEYGAGSAIARSASYAIQNGSNPIICVPFAATINDYVQGGTPGEETYSVSATSKVLTLYPSFPIQIFENGVTLKEGADPNLHDFYVDVSNKTIYFHTARLYVGSIQFKVVDYTSGASDSDTAFTNLESEVANIVNLAYSSGNSDAQSRLRDHLVSTATGSKPRLGITGMAKDDASVTTPVATLAYHKIILVAHKSLADVSAIVAGVISTLQPWQSTHTRAVIGDISDDNFTDNEYDVTFKGAQVIALYNSQYNTGTTFRIFESTTLSNDGFLKYIDASRVVLDVDFKVKAALSNPSLLQDLKLGTTQGVSKLRTALNVLLNGMVNIGEINSYIAVIPLAQIVAKPASERTTEETQRLNLAVSTRTFDVDIDIVYEGQTHYLNTVISFAGVAGV